MVSPELEGLTWVAVHGRGVINTAQASQIALALSQAGVAAGMEAYYYMRYDDSPERVQLPFIYYAVLGNPNIEVVLPEEVEPTGGIFDAVAVLDSSMIVHSTSQRALMLDGTKEDARLVVNTSLATEDILKLVKKYGCAQDWRGKIATVRARKYHHNISFGMIGALAKSLEDVLAFEDVVGALETMGHRGDEVEAVQLSYEETEPVSVIVDARDCDPFRVKADLIEQYCELPSIETKSWDRSMYTELKRRASEAPTYELKIGSMPRWELLAPGLVEFGPERGQRNMGYKTAFSRTFMPLLDRERCTNCKLCHIFCPDGAIDFEPVRVDYDYCTGCGICASVCGPKALTMVHELKSLEDLDEEEVLTIRQALIEYAY